MNRNVTRTFALLALTSLTSVQLLSGCAWLKVAGERIRGQRTGTAQPATTVGRPVDPPPAYLQARADLIAIEKRLKSFNPGSGPAEGPAWEPVYQAANELLWPTEMIEDTLEENPRIKGGPDDLLRIARTYTILDELVGKHQTDIAWAYGLFIEYYPRHAKTDKAKKWLRQHNYEPP